MIISLIIAKILAKFGGTALPGLIGLFFCPGLINQIAKKNNLISIVITGTNGKTSIAYLLRAVLSSQNIGFSSNASGSNLLRGIATSLINQTDIFGSLINKTAIFEVDEGAFLAAVTALKPKIIVITNISRDQLDRYGEVDTVLNQWQKALDHLPQKTAILINAADRRLARLSHPGGKQFGSSVPGAGLIYPGEFAAKFNRDALWAVEAVCRELSLDRRLVRRLARTVPAAFGRGEVVVKNNQNYHLHLVKNPASFKAVWPLAKDNPLLIILNDCLADGTDVSWIWDVPFSGLNNRQVPIVVSGTRAEDLALRLKYAGLPLQLIKLDKETGPALTALTALPGKVKYILPTYTALLALRRHLGLKPWS